VLPHESALRPAWMIRLGLFLYDHLGGRQRLPGSRGLDLRRHAVGHPLKPSLAKGFSYSDCWVDDARLVILNALDAKERGAKISTRSRCISAKREGPIWKAVVQDASGRKTLSARCLVNASGPWVASFVDSVLGLPRRQRMRLVKGSHIVVRRLYDGEQAYILQNFDRRIVFTIPYEQDFTLIGTTDLAYEGDPASVAISKEEIDYLCRVVNDHFLHQIAPADVVWTYAGVRPLHDDESASASAVTRDYVLELDDVKGEAPLLSVFGGKITTFRRLAEQALEKLTPYFPKIGPHWTHAAPLPGGDIPGADFSAFMASVTRRWPWLSLGLGRRYARAYGTRVAELLGNAKSVADLGRHLGDDLYACEVEYLKREEWAHTAEDILWRRSKLGLHVAPATRAALEAWLGEASAIGKVAAP
jgi:glycerol-3-phosphate dehydrogenase